MQTDQGIVTPTPKPTPQSWTAQQFGEDFTPFLLIIAFVMVAVAQMFIAWKRKWEASAAKVVSITTIGFFGVFAALTVNDDKNGAAVFALLGTIAGYILGRDGRPESIAADKDRAVK